MNSSYLASEINAYLEDKDVLTKSEVDELLADCLCYFKNQEAARKKFHETYKGLMTNARKQQEEASSMLKDFEQITDLMKGLDAALKKGQKQT